MEKKSITRVIGYLVSIQLFAILPTAQVLHVQMVPEPYQPFGSEVTGATTNAFLLLLLLLQ